MSLSNKEEATLLKFLIPDKIADQPLETISNLIRQHFCKSDRFKLCRILMFLLDNEFLCNKITQFTALYLIWDMSKFEQESSNMFTEFIASYLQGESCRLPNSAIKVFHNLLRQADESRECSKFTPSQLIDPSTTNSTEVLDWSFISHPNKVYGRLTDVAKSSIMCVIPDEDVIGVHDFTFHSHKSTLDNSVNAAAMQRQCIDNILSQDESSIVPRNVLRPEFIRIAAPYLPCPQGRYQPNCSKDIGHEDYEDTLLFGESDSDVAQAGACSNIDLGWLEELIWLNPDTIVHDFHWNTSTDQVNLTVELRQLILTVMTSALTQSQQQTVVQALKENPNLVYNLGISPELLPNLVNRNPVIAIEALQLLTTSPKRDEYFSALLTMDVSVQSVEVVNRLTTKVELPTDFIRDYIFKCLSFCYFTQDKFHQMRHVRLVCVLLQSLIRNDILDLQDQNILIEVRTFCLDFTKVREASNLYRLVSNLKANSTPPSNTNTNDPNPVTDVY